MAKKYRVELIKYNETKSYVIDIPVNKNNLTREEALALLEECLDLAPNDVIVITLPHP